jgi:hypothetical protein
MGLGLAISTDFMRACETLQGWRSLRLQWCGAAPLPPDLITVSPQEENLSTVVGFGRVLTSIFRGLAFRDGLQVGLPDSSVYIRLLFADGLPHDHSACREYLLGRMADLLGVTPEQSWLAFKAMTNPLPGPRYVVLCSVSGMKVIRQYERALAESGVRYSGLAPSSVLLFNLFQRQLVGPPDVPVLLLNPSEESLTTVMSVDGCPVFWKIRSLGAAGNGDHGSGDVRREKILEDISEATVYAEAKLGTNTPFHVFVTGPLARHHGFTDWLSARVGLPVTFLDAGQLVQREPRGIAAEGWDRWAPALAAAVKS